MRRSHKKVLKDAVREAHALLDHKYELLLATPYNEGTRWGLPASPAVLKGMMTEPKRTPILAAS